MLNISPISMKSVNFKKQNGALPKSYEYRTYQTEATSGKKWGVGIASFVLPGLGQIINNEWGKGIAFFVGTVLGSGVFGSLAMGASFEDALKKSKISTKGVFKNSRALSIVGFAGMLLTAIGGRIWACGDSVKNATSEIKVPVKPD